MWEHIMSIYRWLFSTKCFDKRWQHCHPCILMSVCCSCYCCFGRVSERTNNESKRVEDNSFFHYNNIVSCETSFSLKGLLNLRRINVLYVLWVSESVSQSVSIRVDVCIHVYKLPFSPSISQHRDFGLLMSVCILFSSLFNN